MKSKQGSSTNMFLILLVLVLVVAGLTYWFMSHKTPSPVVTTPVTTLPSTPVATNTYGMTEYIDSANGFSFWYPSTLKVTSTMTQDSKSFPGGVAVETLQVGDMGGTYVTVVDSKTSTITDEPNGHASPIAQTKYAYNSTTEQWMISYPEGTPTGEGSAKPTPVDISKVATTMAGLLMLPAGKRFDTTIIPLNTTRFIAVSDGGGSSFTSELAATISPLGISVPSDIEATTLQAEATTSKQ
jgi:hypothetical protein